MTGCGFDGGLAQQAFHIAALFGKHNSDDVAAVAGAGCAARSVQVSLVFGGRIDVGAVERQNLGVPQLLVVDTLDDVQPTVDAAIQIAYQSHCRVAMLLSQRLLGAKNFMRGDK